MINQQISADSPQLSPQLPPLSPLPFLSYSPSQKMSSQAGPVRNKVAERQSSMEGSSEVYKRSYKVHTGPGPDMESDINQNRDCYRIQDVRPPYTYATLIRQVEA